MANSNVTPPTAAPELSDFTAIITAVVTGFAAYRLFEPKLDKKRAIQNEVGRLEPAFFVHYVLPQYLMIVASTLAVLFLLLAFAHRLRPELVPGFIPVEIVSQVLAMENIIWVIFSLGGIAAAIYWNVPSRMLLLLSRAISALPMPGLQNRFGPSGDSIGWHQAAALIEGPDKGQPLLVDNTAMDHLASELLARMSRNQGHADYAAEPVGLSVTEKANLALFGCIMEANHHARGWPSPNWGAFYASLVDMQARDGTFSPDNITAFTRGEDFFESFRVGLEASLAALGQPTPPDTSLAAAGDIVETWRKLALRGRGSLLALTPWYASFTGGRVATLNRILGTFPRLDSDGMRPQLIKLLIRWNALVEGRGTFAQPFSKRQAWLLVHKGVLRGLPELKEITFNSTGQVPTSSLAVRRLVERVAELIEKGASKEASDVAAKLGSRWARLQQADFELWQWSGEEIGAAKGQKWDKATWRWKYEDNRIQRQS